MPAGTADSRDQNWPANQNLSDDLSENLPPSNFTDWNIVIPRIGLTRAQIVDRVRTSRSEQGLPPGIQEPLILAKMAAIANDRDVDELPANAVAITDTSTEPRSVEPAMKRVRLAS